MGISDMAEYLRLPNEISGDFFPSLVRQVELTSVVHDIEEDHIKSPLNRAEAPVFLQI